MSGKCKVAEHWTYKNIFFPFLLEVLLFHEHLVNFQSGLSCSFLYLCWRARTRCCTRTRTWLWTWLYTTATRRGRRWASPCTSWWFCSPPPHCSCSSATPASSTSSGRALAACRFSPTAPGLRLHFTISFPVIQQCISQRFKSKCLYIFYLFVRYWVFSMCCWVGLYVYEKPTGIRMQAQKETPFYRRKRYVTKHGDTRRGNKITPAFLEVVTKLPFFSRYWRTGQDKLLVKYRASVQNIIINLRLVSKNHN